MRLISFTIDSTLDAVSACRVLDLFQVATGQKCTVLIYHSVASGEHNPYIDPATFASHMDMLSSEFHVIGADEYLSHLNRGNGIRGRSVLITIDDGLENNYTVVRPIMEQRGLPWVVFSTTQALEGNRLLWFAILRGICLYTRESSISVLGQSWPLDGSASRLKAFEEMADRLSRVSADQARAEVDAVIAARGAEVPESYVANFCRLMGPDQLCELAKDERVEVGCHTRTHPFLPRVPDEQLTSEIDQPTRNLADLLNRKTRMFAYPVGIYGHRELRRVVELGYDCAFAVKPLLGTPGKYDISRVGIYNRSVSVARAKSLGLSSLLEYFGVQNG